MRSTSALLITATLLMAGEAAAQARIFCCDDAKGRKVCADFVPPECANRAYEERDGQGRLAKKYDAPLTAEQQARRAAEQVQADEEKRKAMDAQRRSAALLSNYANEKEIDAARDRALAAMEKNRQQLQAKLDQANMVKKKLEKEQTQYKNKPLPPETKAAIRSNESELSAHQAAMDALNKEMAETRARFEEEKQQYLNLTGKKAEATSPEKGTAESVVKK